MKEAWEVDLDKISGEKKVVKEEKTWEVDLDVIQEGPDFAGNQAAEEKQISGQIGKLTDIYLTKLAATRVQKLSRNARIALALKLINAVGIHKKDLTQFVTGIKHAYKPDAPDQHRF